MEIEDTRGYQEREQSTSPISRFLHKETDFGVNTGTFKGLDAFEPGQETVDFLKRSRVLVIGAGGLGCEILKCLIYDGFEHIDIIDMDTIDLTNLNRQFLFREEDIGKPKATTAVNFFKNKFSSEDHGFNPFKDVVLNSHNKKIQDMPHDFYMDFSVVISGLDNIEARRWINSKLFQIAEDTNFELVIPIIDGGTEGLKGQCRVIIPGVTSCFECTLGLFTQEKNTFPMCTITNKPRLPEHCIEFCLIKVNESNSNFAEQEKIQKVYENAKERAKEFGIEGVTWDLTNSVLRNIVPAIASTNSCIAAACVTEAFKYCTYSGQILNNYFLLLGNCGINTTSYSLDKSEGCPVCNRTQISMTMVSNAAFSEFVENLKRRFSLEDGSFILRSKEKVFYQMNIPQLKVTTKSILNVQLQKLFDDSILLYLTSVVLPQDAIEIVLKLEAV
eukprot:maker-scaffold_7-snap-gene-11.39-mRNA-1 protein AED:0.25 eAED:0.25 QI:145/0.5/0.33/1/1/1/3/0/444